MKWSATAPARRTGWARDDDGIKRQQYRCKFVSDGYLTPGAEWEECIVEFYARRPGAAVKKICEAGRPLRFAGKIIN